MKANSGLKKNRTKIQMVLTALVILSVVRQFFLGNYHNMFLGILTLILFMVPQFSGQETERHNTTGTGNSHSDLYLFSRNSWRNQCLLCKNPYLGYHFAYY